MKTYLNVAEKPYNAQMVATILARGPPKARKNDVWGGTPVFEFKRVVSGEEIQMLVTSVSGHIKEYDFIEPFNEWLSCSPIELLNSDTKVHKRYKADMRGIVTALWHLAKECTTLILWTDNDSQGENIGVDIKDLCVKANPRLVNAIRRARFVSFNESDIETALEHPSELNTALSASVDMMTEINLRVGAAFTRFQTLYFYNAFQSRIKQDYPDLKKPQLSYGTCKGATLGMIVDKSDMVKTDPNKSHMAFSLICKYLGAEFRGKRYEDTPHYALVKVTKLTTHPSATVTNVCEVYKALSLMPLNTIELQTRLSQQYRVDSKSTLEAAQKLYSDGYISYPRTESNTFPVGFDFVKIVQKQVRHPVWGNYAQRLLEKDENLWQVPLNGGEEDAHPPIYPTKCCKDDSTWHEHEKLVYRLVVCHFLSSLSRPPVVVETKVDIVVAQEELSASMTTAILQRTYMDIYDSRDAVSFPRLTKNQQFTVTNIEVESLEKSLTESELLCMMKRENIGTAGTRHEHISNLLLQFYAERNDRMVITPTTLGRALFNAYKECKSVIWTAELRNFMDMNMREISQGTKQREEGLNTVLQYMKKQYEHAHLNRHIINNEIYIEFERDPKYEFTEFVKRCSSGRHTQSASWLLKWKQDGRPVIRCSKYSECGSRSVRIPSSVYDLYATTNTCSICISGPYLLLFKFHKDFLPKNFNTSRFTPLNFPRECGSCFNHVGCIGGCNTIISDLYEHGTY